MLTATLGGVVGPPEEAGLSDPTVSAGVAGVWVAGCMYFVFANLTFFLNNPGIVVFEKDGRNGRLYLYERQMIAIVGTGIPLVCRLEMVSAGTP